MWSSLCRRAGATIRTVDPEPPGPRNSHAVPGGRHQSPREAHGPRRPAPAKPGGGMTGAGREPLAGPGPARGHASPRPDAGRPIGLRRATTPLHAGGLAAAVVLAGLLAACGGPTTRPATPAAPSRAPTAPATPAVLPSAAASAASRLGAALTRLAPGYRFETTVRIGDVVATTIAGRVRDGASEVEATAGGTTEAYLSVPPRAWTRRSGGAWEAVDTGAPASNHLEALWSPEAIEVEGDDGTILRLIATYPAAALGLTGSDPVSVTLLIAGNGTLTATFTAATSGGEATSETTFRPDPDGAPIVAPPDPSASPPA